MGWGGQRDQRWGDTLGWGVVGWYEAGRVWGARTRAEWLGSGLQVGSGYVVLVWVEVYV